VSLSAAARMNEYVCDRTRIGADSPSSLAQDLMSSSDPEYGRKGLDMSLAQRRY
jgi:hypothetical protein